MDDYSVMISEEEIRQIGEYFRVKNRLREENDKKRLADLTADLTEGLNSLVMWRNYATD